MRSDNDIRVEINRQKKRIEAFRTLNQRIDAAAAAIIVSTLTWVIGDSEDPCRRTKIR